ncbi:hypothetical protein BHM03_00055386, partial [Ensete ventricosum]
MSLGRREGQGLWRCGCGDADNKEGQRVPTRGPARKKWEQQGPASSGVRRGVAGAAVWLKNGCAPAGWGCRRQMGAATATIEARMRCGSRKRRRRYCASTGKKERAAAEEAAGKQRQRGRVAGSGQRRQVRSREEGSAEGVRLERRRRQRRCAAAAVGEEEKKRQRRQPNSLAPSWQAPDTLGELPTHSKRLPYRIVCNFDLYRPVQAVHTGPLGYRYIDRPLPGGSVKNRLSTVNFGRQRPIEEEIDRRWSIEEEKGKKKRKRKKKRGRKNTSPARRPRSPAVTARRSPTRRRPSRIAHGHDRFFSRVRRRSVSPRGEKDRGD